MRNQLWLCIALIGLIVGSAQAINKPIRKTASEEDKPNCKLAVRTKYKSGKKKVDVVEIHAMDRADCKEQAKRRELNSDPEEIDTVSVTFGWRPPTE